MSLLNTAGSPNNWRLMDQPIYGHLSWDTVIHIQSQPEGFVANSYLLKIKQHENRLQLWLEKFSFDLHHLPPSYIYLLAFIAWLVTAITYSLREWNISVKQDPSVRTGGWMHFCFCFFSTTHKLHFTFNFYTSSISSSFISMHGMWATLGQYFPFSFEYLSSSIGQHLISSFSSVAGIDPKDRRLGQYDTYRDWREMRFWRDR